MNYFNETYKGLSHPRSFVMGYMKRARYIASWYEMSHCLHAPGSFVNVHAIS